MRLPVLHSEPSKLEELTLRKPHVVKKLCDMLHLENNPLIQADIIRALGYSQDEFAIRHIKSYVGYRNNRFGIVANREVQVNAAFALVELGDPAVVDRVTKQIKLSKSPRTKYELANALWRFVNLARLKTNLSNKMEQEVKRAEAVAKKYRP
jgi:hypothetical protein